MSFLILNYFICIISVSLVSDKDINKIFRQIETATKRRIRGVREPEILGRVRNTKFFLDRNGYPKISRFSNLSGFPKELGFRKGLRTNLNNLLKPTSSTISKGRRSRTIIQAIPSVTYIF